MSAPETVAEVLSVIERHVDEAHRLVLRSATDPGRSLPRFKTKSEQAQERRALTVLLKVLVEARADGSDADRLRKESYERIDGAVLEREDTLIRRRLQGIPEVAPQLK
ncbi:MAG: hypothetical protein LC797_03000 [Chloroflexi bacterium]|nr:hypothetical protein [Chloroflexota bacterium]